MKYMDTILYGIIIALLLILIGRVETLSYRIDRVYEQTDELDRTITRGAMTGKIGEEVK